MKSPYLRAPALSIGLLALTACGKKEQGPPQMPPPQVGVVTVQPRSEPLTKDLVGRLSAYRSADVLARVSGLLLKRVYTEGSDVKQGQLMFEIDPAPYQATLNSALGNLASAKATYANAHVVAERDRSLIPMGYVSRAQLDSDEAAERSAAAAVQQAEASVQNARINLAYTRVTAPIDGRSGEQQVTEGAIVGNSTSDAGANSTLLTTVQQLDPLYVNFTMSAADLSALQSAEAKGQVALAAPDKTTMQVSLPDGSSYDHKGTLDFSAAVVNATTGAVNLRGVLPNPEHRLLPGTYVTLTVDLGQQHNVFLVPQQAVSRDVGGAYVLVVDKDGKAARKNVVADNNQGHQWIVTSGLSAGDQVIVSGLQGGSPMGIQPGMPVKPTPWQPDGAPQAGSQPSSAAAKS